jgi:hypothetical protein
MDIVILEVYTDQDTGHKIQSAAALDGIGGFTLINLNLNTGELTEFMLDAISAHTLFEIQQKFYKGEYPIPPID